MALRLGFPEDALAQLLTVFADALGRVAETEARLFHFYVHERLRAEGLTGAALMSSTMATSEPLMSLVEPALRYFHRKGMTRAVRDDAFLHFAAESGSVRAPEVTGQLVAICFVDLAGFTSLTDAMGDLTAIDVLARFSTLVRAAADRHRGRVIKQIGDEFMLVFGDPVAAVGAIRC